ncbi:MAG: type II toxin-antitoxin system HicA family toxin [Bacteroidales bacterium]
MNPKNIPVNDFRRYLISKGLRHIRTNGSHEIWSRRDLLRPVVLQSNIDPVPVFIIKNNLRNMGETIADLIKFMSNK